MQNLNSTIILLAFLLIELFLFHGFYSRREGRRAVYTAWYAWIIDLAAMFSGVTIMGLSLLCLYYPNIFTISVPNFLFYTLFFVGSWQFGIHFVKLIIRNTFTRKLRKTIKKKYPHKADIHKFEDEYNKEMEDYYKSYFNKK